MLTLSLVGAAQEKKYKIRVLDSKNKGLEYVSVRLLSNDSVVKCLDITDSSGWVYCTLENDSSYFLKISALGFKSIEQKLVVHVSDTSYSFVLLPSGNMLNEVVISRAKPLMRQEDDKTIIDPEQLAEASTSAYEVLEKTPGLFIDQDGNIYISSITPALVYINGRELKMSRADVAIMLKNLPPNSIEKIEIMRTASAKYDASGSGGIVNVVLKKGVKLGLNGSVNAGAQQGVYGNQFAGFSLNNNNDKWSTYVNANVTQQNNYQQLNTNRVLAIDTLLSQKAYTKYPGQVYFGNFGVNYDFNNQWSFSYDTRLSYNHNKSNTDNYNDIKVESTNKTLGSILSQINNNNRTLLIDQSLSSKYKIDSNGSEWNNTLSYTYSDNSMNQDYLNSSILGNTSGDGIVNTHRHFWAMQSDFNHKLKYQINFETGIKSTFLFFDNKAAYNKMTGTLQQIDYARSNQYRYTENINAAYIQAAKTFGSFILKTGLRLENTNMEGMQKKPADTSFAINRSDLFPYIYFSKKIMAIAGYDLRAYLVYRRTISRPSYEQLNPFPKYVDQFMSEIGNPALKPQFTQNYEANVSVNEHPLLAIGYNDTKDLFTNVFYQADSTATQAYRGYDNIGTNKEWYLRGLAAIPPGGKYFAVLGAQYNRNIYSGLYQVKPLDFTAESWLFFTYHQLKLDKKTVLTLNGFWRLAGPLQFYELSAMGSLNASVNRKLMKDKLSLSLSVTDIFYSNNNRFIVNQGDVAAQGSRATDSRRYGINLSYNFGVRKKEEHPSMFDINVDGKK
jgi:iron complex outermembrane recepter protein